MEEDDVCLEQPPPKKQKTPNRQNNQIITDTPSPSFLNTIY